MERMTSRRVQSQELEVYLRRHWLLAYGGTRLASRIADVTPDTDLRADLGDLAREVGADCSALLLSLAAAGVRPSRMRRAGVTVTELLGRHVPNRSWSERSALADVMELEALAGVLVGTRAAWECIRRLALDDPWWRHHASGHWLRRNAAQESRTGELYKAAVAAAFAPPAAPVAAALSRPEGTAAP